MQAIENVSIILLEMERNQRVARRMATDLPILMGLIMEMAMAVAATVEESANTDY